MMVCGFFLFLLLTIASGTAHADVVWPALYLETRLLAWWVILSGLLVEFFFIWKIFDLSPKRALIANLAANGASALLGVLLIPVAGLLWELFSHFTIGLLWNIRTFHPVTWCATYVLACLVNTALENFVLQKAFRLPFTRRTFAWLLGANAISVGMAFASLRFLPLSM